MPEDMDLMLERLRAGYGAFNRGDFEEASRWIHPEIEWIRVADVESSLRGREAVTRNLEPSLFGSQESEILGMEVVGDSILVESRFRAVGRASGAPVEQHGYHLWRIRDGMAIRFEYFLDREEAVARARRTGAGEAG